MMKFQHLFFLLFSLIFWSAPGFSTPLDLLPTSEQKTERFSRLFSKEKRTKKQKRGKKKHLRVLQGCDTLMLANGVKMLITDAKEKGPYLRFRDCEDPSKKFFLHQRDLSALRYQDGTIRQFLFREREQAQKEQSQTVFFSVLLLTQGF
jgi:hypothetical protein